MSFPRYPYYKQTDAFWPTEVPKHWDVRRVKQQFSLVTTKSGNGGNPVALENVESWTGRLIPTDGIFDGDRIQFHSGDILFGKLRPNLAKVYLADAPGQAVGDFFVLRPLAGLHGRSAQYQMLAREFISIIVSSTFGAKMPRVDWEFLGTMALVVPSDDEQAAIVAFLDRETGKIDALISEQRRLTELLNEKLRETSATKTHEPAVQGRAC